MKRLITILVISILFLSILGLITNIKSNPSPYNVKTEISTSTNELFGIDSFLLNSTEYNLSLSTFFGGTSDSTGQAIAVDSAGNIYIAGDVYGSDFPVKNAYNTTYGGNGKADCFIAKFDSSRSLVFSTYLGGSSADYLMGMALDELGNIYVMGRTASTDFPTKNAFNDTFGGGYDVFLSKFSPNGALDFSTYFGGSSTDYGLGIDVNSSGAIFITGKTISQDFPIKNAYNATFGGGWDIFVSSFDSTGILLASTFIGGNANDEGDSITFDEGGNWYLTGSTQSPNFPTKQAFNDTFSGNNQLDAFVSKFDSSNQMVFSTYIGGNVSDAGTDLVSDSQGNVYVVGHTTSANFPTKNAYDSTYGGGATYDTFLTKFTSVGDLVYSTFLGGTDNDYIPTVSLDNNSNIYIVGSTYSADFPIKNGIQDIFGGISDLFVTKFNSTENLIFSSFLGGTSIDLPHASTIDQSGNIYVTGRTQSADFPVENAINSTFGGNSENFISIFTPKSSSFTNTTNTSLNQTNSTNPTSDTSASQIKNSEIISDSVSGTLSSTITNLSSEMTLYSVILGAVVIIITKRKVR